MVQEGTLRTLHKCGEEKTHATKKTFYIFFLFPSSFDVAENNQNTLKLFFLFLFLRKEEEPQRVDNYNRSYLQPYPQSTSDEQSTPLLRILFSATSFVQPSLSFRVTGGTRGFESNGVDKDFGSAPFQLFSVGRLSRGWVATTLDLSFETRNHLPIDVIAVVYQGPFESPS